MPKKKKRKKAKKIKKKRVFKKTFKKKRKKIKHLNHLPLIKQSRLSVMPIDSKSWKILNNMGNIKINYGKKIKKKKN